ncbi:MAG: DUF2927 domain-containing protein [Rhodobacteraceae bacterium]|nr:DUF2927 domain-containing protein [Paracoccaceae bacterium]
MKRIALLAALATLGACAPGYQDESHRRMDGGVATSSLPAMKSFAAPDPSSPQQSNADFVRDFLDLSFKLESGRTLPVFTRFEQPITVRIDGPAPPVMASDLNRLLFRMRQEAGVDIHLIESGHASVTVNAVSRREIQRFLPDAACFVAPNVSTLQDFRQARRADLSNWGGLRSRDRLAIFLPLDTSPQEMRDCLHEELAQAIGPLNDLYRLPDSVFNDDNIHTVLTGHDMLILRAYYDPVLQNGMTRNDVAARLPRIFARINPNGQGLRTRALQPTPREWIIAVQTALGPGTQTRQRRLAAAEALRIAKDNGWEDHRRGFSHFVIGRMLQLVDAEEAYGHFQTADQYFRTAPSADLHRAQVAGQIAAYHISRGLPSVALEVIEPHIATASKHENAALLSTLMMLKSEALALTGKTDQANEIRLDSLGWARYGFGPDWAVRAKLREIRALYPG